MPEFEEQVLQWFFKRTKNSASGKLLAKGIIAKLRDEVINDPVAIRKALVRLRDDGHIDFTPDQRGEPLSSYITVVRRVEHVPEYVQRWSSVLDEKGAGHSNCAALLPLAETIRDLSKDDMGHLVEGLLKLRQDQANLFGQAAYLISARYLLGSSKLLNSLGRRHLKAFGIQVDRFSNHPFYVVVAGCAQPEAVVLVENPAAFEMAVATSAANRCAFIATFGFGLSKTQESYGEQLANMVEAQFSNAITLAREGSSCPTAEGLLKHPNITFWGDLDVAGIEIFRRLKRVIPALRLSALYKPMLDVIRRDAFSHPYVLAVGKQGQIGAPALCEDLTLKEILAICATRGVDQECVLPEQFEQFAPYELVLGR